MRIILQRVRRAAVSVAGEEVASIGRGMLVLVGVVKEDDRESASRAADKLAGLRIFEDDGGRMNLAADAVAGEFLVVSQFTLAASVDRGRRPSFDRAARPEVAEPLVESLAGDLEARGFSVQRGRFGAHMEVELVNDGPVTFVFDS